MEQPFWNVITVYEKVLLFNDFDIYRSELSFILRIRFYIKSDFLSFAECSESISDDRRVMYEYIISAFIICEKSISLIWIEPFDRSVFH